MEPTVVASPSTVVNAVAGEQFAYVQFFYIGCRHKFPRLHFASVNQCLWLPLTRIPKLRKPQSRLGFAQRSQILNLVFAIAFVVVANVDAFHVQLPIVDFVG